jgi:high-affinity Fe2+/Pb2+ permease
VSDDSPPSDEPDKPPRSPVPASKRGQLAIAVALAVLLLLYSVLVAQQLLLWVGFVTPFALLYLLWRFVRAHERIAAAQERRARLGERRHGAEDAVSGHEREEE